MRLRFPLFKATYEWILDHDLTPYFLVNAHYPKVNVPQEYVEEGQIVLDASVEAVDNMYFDEEGVSFSASFDGKIMDVYFPIEAIQGLYAEETEQGMFMSDDPVTFLVQEGKAHVAVEVQASHKESSPSKKELPSRGHLKLVK